MKSIILFYMMCMSVTYGAIELPKGSFQITELEEAKKEAKEKKRPIAFVYTNVNTSCGLCKRATYLMFKEFKRKAIFVYVKDRNNCPENVKNTLKSKGKYIPKLAVYNHDLSRDLGLVIYEDIKAQGDDAFKPLVKVIRTYIKDQ